MNKRIKELWTKALRSGEYQQGTGTLCSISLFNGESYCCLGVLCDLAVKDGVPLNVTTPNNYRLFDGEDCVLPRAVFEWADLPDANPEIGVEERDSAAGLNDNGHTFEKIADLIEASL